MNEIEEIMANIIEVKYQEVIENNLEEGPFDKIRHFEGNAIGQIGEKFVKKAFELAGVNIDNDADIIHDEYDVLIGETKIEIKTARRGANGTFQFNGLNPIYNHDYIILIGITPSTIYYQILKKDQYRYDHATRSHFYKIKGNDKKLVSMNPGNSVNYKLTLNTNYMETIDNFVEKLASIGVLAKINHVLS